MAPRFTRETSRCVVLPRANVDTDQIIPARFLKIVDKEGLGARLFNDWRYREDGSDDPEFPLNQPAARGAAVLVAGDNFGCGSSREHAPWALVAWGLRAVISTSFADIFRGNALKNGLVPVTVPADVHARLLALLAADPAGTVTVDLTTETLTLPDGTTQAFSIDPFARRCLLEGVDELGYLLTHLDAIARHEERTAS